MSEYMDNETWQTIAAMIMIPTTFVSALVGGWVAGKVQARLSQPTATPEPNQAKTLPQRIKGLFIRFAISVWLNVWLIWFSTFMLIFELFFNPDPLTRLSVFTIAISVGSLVWNLEMITSYIHRQKQGKFDVAVASGMIELAKATKHSSDATERLLKIVEAIMDEQDKSTIDRLIEAAKKLLK